MGIFK